MEVTGSVGSDLLRGIQRIGLADLQNVLCADGKGVAAGTVCRGDQHGNVLIALGIGGACQSKDAGQLDRQIVPVADLIADLDLDGRVIAGLAAAQHSSSAQSSGRSTGDLEEGAAGNLVRHKACLLNQWQKSFSSLIRL